MILFTAAFCLVLSGCEGSIEKACSEFPRVEEEISLQVIAFHPYTISNRELAQVAGKGNGRKPASVVSGVPGGVGPSPEQKEAWLDWTEALLKKSQKVRDTFEADSKRRPALKAMEDASLTLVTLHGFIEQGKMKKAQGSLEKLRKNLKSAYENACVAKIDVKAAPAGHRKPASKSRR